MLEVKKFTFNPFSENTFIISNKSSKAVIIDPGCYYKAEQKELDDYISNNQLNVQCVLHTHSHLDHMFGTAHVVEKYNVKLWIHREDKITYDSFEKVCELYGIPIHKRPIQNPVFLNLHKPFQIDDITFQILFVPGHSPGHVAFFNKENNFVINGDCLFENSIGRTDLPGGDYTTLMNSITSKILCLPEKTSIFCGHGDVTSLADEKKYNPFLQ